MKTISEATSISVNLHDSQGLIQLINPNILYALWQRAGGKTGGGIGPRLVHLDTVMPRSQILLFSDTYDRLEKRIVPNIINFISSKLGLIEGIDFVKYKKPPDYFEKPLVPLDFYERVISFASGMCLCLVSLHVEGSANAYNAQAAIGDEVKYCRLYVAKKPCMGICRSFRVCGCLQISLALKPNGCYRRKRKSTKKRLTMYWPCSWRH